MGDFSQALYDAVIQNNLETVWQLLDAGAVYHPAPGQSPLLSVAVARGYAEIAARLLEHGHAPDALDAAGLTPLIQAITRHDAALVKTLLRHGAAPDAPTLTPIRRMPPLAYAREDPQHNAAIIAALLEQLAARYPGQATPADLEKRNKYGRTRPHHLAEGGRCWKKAQQLLQVGADPNARDQYGYTPLHDSVLGDHAAIIQALLAAGADPAARPERGIHAGYTALEIARIERKENAIRLLTPVSPTPRPLTPCEPELREDGTVKGFSHRDYEKQVAKNARLHERYLRKRKTAQPYWVDKYNAPPTEPCSTPGYSRYGSQYRGTGIPPAEHPLRWRIAFEGCLHCGSADVLVVQADWGVSLSSGDLSWGYEIKCQQCGTYSSWSFDDG